MSDWHQLDTADAIERLETDSAAGLTSAEASRRLAERGPNELQAAHGVSPWEIFVAQLKNVLIIILIIAVALSAFLGFARKHKEIYRIIDEAEFADPAAYRAHYGDAATRIAARLDAAVERGDLLPGDNEVRAWAIMGANVLRVLRDGVVQHL